MMIFHRGHQHQRQLPVTRREVSEARFQKFAHDFQAYERKAEFDETLNTFLDLYSAWMKMHEPWMKIRLVMLAFELNRLDPTFECTLAFTDDLHDPTP